MTTQQLVHEYAKVNINILKDIKENYLVELKAEINNLIEKLEENYNAD